MVYATGTHTYFGKTAELVAGRSYRQSFPACGAQNRQLPDRFSAVALVALIVTVALLSAMTQP